MAYTLTVPLFLGAANTGLTLTAELRNSDGTVAAGLTTTTMLEVSAGSGNYEWTGTLPEGHRGYIRFFSGATFKTHVGIDPTEVETARVVWAYDSRTLTLTAAQIAAILSGSTLTLERGETLVIPITGLGSLVGRSKLWFTLKSQHSHTDAQSLVQIEESGGLLYLNGAAAVTAADGSLVVTDANAGNITITLKPAATAVLSPANRLYWDVQSLVSAVISTRTVGSANISADVTRAVS